MRKTEEYNISLSEDNEVVEKKVKKKEKIGLFDVVGAIVAAMTVVVILFLFCFRVFIVDGCSMVPTLEEGDKIIVSTVGYKPKRGDIVVISHTADENNTTRNKPIVKRIIAIEGDVVDIDIPNGIVKVNGIEEHYSEDLTNQAVNTAFPITVGEGEIFVLGDNRDVSHDSRNKAIGCIDERLIVGKVMFRLSFGDWVVE